MSQYNLRSQIKTRQGQFGRLTCIAGATTASSHGKVIFTSAAVGRAGQEQHPALPPLTSKPLAGIFRLSEGSRAGRYQA